MTQDINSFAFIFDQLKSRRKKNIFDFYLFVISKDYFFFDYVTGYVWEIGEYIDFFVGEDKRFRITRKDLEIKICNVLNGKGWIDYFGYIKGSDNQETSLVYSVRQKLFDFVYRNQNSVAAKDLGDVALFRIEKQIKSNDPKKAVCVEALNLFFNKHLLGGITMNGENMLLKRVKQSREAVVDGKYKEFNIQDDEEWAYYAGQVAYYLVGLSKSGEKTYGLLEPFTNKSTTKLIKVVIQQLFERYKHEINLSNQRFRVIATKVLSYNIEKSFINLKIPFYTGAFDDSVFYSKEEKTTEAN